MHRPSVSIIQFALRNIVFLLALVATQIGTPTPSIAQTETLSDSQIAAAIPLLTDKEVRQLLVSRLKNAQGDRASTTEEFNPAIFVYRLQNTLGKVGSEVSLIGQAVVELPGVFPRAWDKFTSSAEGGSVSGFLLSFIIALFVGALIEWAIGRSISWSDNSDAKMTPYSTGAKLSRLSIIAGFRLFQLAVFAGVVTAIYLLMFSTTDQFRVTFFFYLSALMVFRVAMVLSNAFYAPRNEALRLPNYKAEDALFFHRTLGATVVMGGFGFFTCALFGTLGISGHVHGLMLILVGTMTIAGLIWSATKGREAISTDITIADGDHPFRSSFARIWPWIYATLVLTIWIGLVIAELTDAFVHYGAALFTIGMLAVLPSLDALIEREAIRYNEAGDDAHAAGARTLRILGCVFSVLAIAISWGIKPLSMAESGLGVELSRGLMQVGVTLLVAYIIWQVIRTMIDRKIAEEDAIAEAVAIASGKEPGAEIEIGGAGLSRIRTLLPLFRRTIQISLSVILVMILLASLGVDIGPILAGAGVLGLAIGFGSQALVRDIVSGVFFLIDDAFRLGEYIDVGAVKGVVEKMSIRSLQLRHHRGAVHTVPFGEIKTLTNYSRDWAIMKLKFRVPFDTDVKKVKKIFKKIGKELLENPDISEDFIQPLKSQGVIDVDDYGLVLRAKFTAKPGRQFVIRKEAYSAIQKAFDENGIEFAKPIIRVSVGDEVNRSNLSESTQQAAGAAAGLQVTQPAKP